MSGQVELKGPDFAKEGIAATDIVEGAMAVGRADGEAVLVARTGGRLYAIGAVCSHYGGPLGEASSSAITCGARGITRSSA
jgi:nitrite reductase/ring-hydroxylating ferredoxin subunit